MINKNEKHISEIFPKDKLYSKKNLKDEKDEDEEEWFIDDGPPKNDTQVIFLRAGSKYDDSLVTEAS